MRNRRAARAARINFPGLSNQEFLMMIIWISRSNNLHPWEVVQILANSEKYLLATQEEQQ